MGVTEDGQYEFDSAQAAIDALKGPYPYIVNDHGFDFEDAHAFTIVTGKEYVDMLFKNYADSEDFDFDDEIGTFVGASAPKQDGVAEASKSDLDPLWAAYDTAKQAVKSAGAEATPVMKAAASRAFNKFKRLCQYLNLDPSKEIEHRRTAAFEDKGDVAYRGYIIRVGSDGSFFIIKDGFTIARPRDMADAKHQIDQLVD